MATSHLVVSAKFTERGLLFHSVELSSSCWSLTGFVYTFFGARYSWRYVHWITSELVRLVWFSVRYLLSPILTFTEKAPASVIIRTNFMNPQKQNVRCGKTEQKSQWEVPSGAWILSADRGKRPQSVTPLLMFLLTNSSHYCYSL